jgi:hypothetical protein
MDRTEKTLTDNERITDHSELKPSLPPNSVTFADILSTHEAILSEMKSFRTDLAVFKSLFIDKPTWVTEFLESATGLVKRVDNVSKRLNDQEKFCHFKHPSNGT